MKYEMAERPMQFGIDTQDPDTFNRAALVQRVRNRWKQYPGSAPMGSGDTGLTRSDSKGFADQLSENFQALQALRSLEGKQEYSTEYGGEIADPSASEPFSSVSMNALRQLAANDANDETDYYQRQRRK